MPLREKHIGYFTTLHSIRIPSIIKAIAWMLFVAVFVVAAFLVFVPWVQNAPGAGSVTALNPDDRLQDINALVSGRIEQWYVRDGSPVKKGDPIVRLVDNDPQLLERLEAERNQVLAKRNAAEGAYRTAKLDLARAEGLLKDGLASRRDFEQASIRVEERRGTVAEMRAELNRIDVNISRQSVQVVRAPRDGTILTVSAGDSATYITAGQRIATFVPGNVPRAVELFIDGRDVALVRVGSSVRLEFEGWPAFQFSGWPELAMGTFEGQVAAIDLSAGQDGRFRVLVTEVPDGSANWPDQRFIRLGSAARGWILFDTVNVGYELWRQLNDFPPQYSAGPNPTASTGQSGTGQAG